MPVTFSFREKNRGCSSTLTLSALALMNGDLLKAGSSATDRSDASTPPSNSDSFRFPNFTSRPRAFVSSASRRGLKSLASIRKGSASAITSSNAIRIPSKIRIRFIAGLRLSSLLLETRAHAVTAGRYLPAKKCVAQRRELSVPHFRAVRAQAYEVRQVGIVVGGIQPRGMTHFVEQRRMVRSREAGVD